MVWVSGGCLSAHRMLGIGHESATKQEIPFFLGCTVYCQTSRKMLLIIKVCISTSLFAALFWICNNSQYACTELF